MRNLSIINIDKIQYAKLQREKISYNSEVRLLNKFIKRIEKSLNKEVQKKLIVELQ